MLMAISAPASRESLALVTSLQGWEFIGADAVEMDYTDLALKFKQFSQDCARHGVVLEHTIKPPM